jgi:dienelactone hydrolase
LPVLNRSLSTTAIAGTLVLLSLAMAGCGGSNGGNGVPATSITLSTPADLGTIAPGAEVQISATVSNDPSNSGVTWSVECSTTACGTVTADKTASGEAMTYVAPSGFDSPPTDLVVSITATSASNPTARASTKVTVRGGVAIVEFDATNTLLLAGTTSQVAAKLINDPASRGVTWSASCAASDCGTFSPNTSASGVFVTYTAPAAVPPADLAVVVTASSVSEPSVQASDTLTVSTLAITVSATPSQLAARATAQITASVNYPAPADQAVTWAVTCAASDCGNVSPSTSQSGAAVTYTAPAASPPTNLAVTVTASSASAPSVQGSAALTIAAITVGVTPISALLPLGIAQQFVGNVGSDPTSSGVAWTLTQGGAPCSAVCGSMSPATSTNGAASTYTAPSVQPTNAVITVTAASIADQTKSASATVQLTAGSVQLVPTDLSFAKRGAHQGTTTLTNTGTSPLTISGITIGGTTPKPFTETDSCGGSVAPQTSCTITVSYNWAKGSGSATLMIADGSSDSPQLVHLSTGGQSQVTPAMVAALASQTMAVTPAPTGANPVGSRDFQFIDAIHPDPYLADGTKREIQVRFWYPASAEGRCVAAPYATPQVWKYFSTLLGVSLPQVSVHSCLNAQIAGGVYPVVMISHGFTGTSSDYTFLAEDLASRGYVVASVNHTREATAVEFPDGRLEKSVFGSYLTRYVRSDTGALGFAVSVRLDDLRLVLSELQRLNAEGGRFAGRLDLNRIALAGHSLGGLATVRALSSESRFKAGVLLDGLVPPSLDRPVSQPVLMLAAGHERWNEDDCRLWAMLRGPRFAVNLPGAEHLALSDAAWLLRGSVQAGDAGPDAMIAATRGYVANFLDAHLRGAGAERLAAGIGSDRFGGVVAGTEQTPCVAQETR